MKYIARIELEGFTGRDETLFDAVAFIENGLHDYAEQTTEPPKYRILEIAVVQQQDSPDGGASQLPGAD